MKKHLIILMSLVPVSFLFSQVGINTENPQGIFHIDGGKDNPLTGAPPTAQQANDFVVTADGNVGIGTTTPTRKLEIVSATSPSLRLNDGTQRAGYYLMSDENGNGSWKSLTTSITAASPANGFSGPINSSNTYIGVSITLPPGRWLVLTNIQLKGSITPSGGRGTWTRLGWSRTQNTSDTSGIIGPLNSGNLITPYGLATGSSIINNTSTSDTTFYLNLVSSFIYGGYTGNWDRLGASSTPENSIIAYPAN